MVKFLLGFLVQKVAKKVEATLLASTIWKI